MRTIVNNTARALIAVALILIVSCGGEKATEKERSAAETTASGMPRIPDGPLTPQARIQVAIIADSTGQAQYEAMRVLSRIGRDAVPAMVEALEAPINEQSKQLILSVVGNLGVAADRATPYLENMKITGPGRLATSADYALRQIEQWKTCGFADLPDDIEVHVVGQYKGKKELDIQLGDSGHMVTQIDVIVDHTEKPMVLVLTAYDPVVWNVGQAPRSKLAAVYLSGYHTQALIGIPKTLPHRVSSGEQSAGCEAFHADNLSEAPQIEPKIRALTGHGIEHFHVGSSQSHFRVGGDPYMEPSNVDYSSDLSIDDYPVYRGEVPAGPKGIEELERRGKIRLATMKDLEAWNAGASKDQFRFQARSQVTGVYVVLEAIALPPGLYGAHSRTFIIPAGIPKPEGPKGHCTLLSMANFTRE